MDDLDLPAVPAHPLGIKPSGNAYASFDDIRVAIGTLSTFSDELLIQVLELLDAKTLVRLGRTCKALYAFSAAEELWKTLSIEYEFSPLTEKNVSMKFHLIITSLLSITLAEISFSPYRRSSPASRHVAWRGTWRSTYLNLPSSRTPQIDCKHLFSDVLYRPFYCAHALLEPFTSSIPSTNRISRLHDLTAEGFSSTWSNRPFILDGPVHEWPVYSRWSTSNLLEQYADVQFRAEAVDWPLKQYVQYMEDNADESPLYLFDRSFVEKMGLKATRGLEADYWAPDCFGEDLFSVLGEQRPDSRWLIIGPERSGSTFHKDPNATSAWNAVITGAKYWIMFPSSPNDPPPPGVYVSIDQSEVTSPLSIMEWLLAFHAEARQTKGCIEGVCHAGEVLHVPSGWWHLVVNLRPSIAITQNFIPRAHLPAALSFLRDKPDQVSGFKPDILHPYETFVVKLGELHPELLQNALNRIVPKSSDGSKKRRWEQVVSHHERDEATKEGGFRFAFGGESDNDDGEGP